MQHARRSTPARASRRRSSATDAAQPGFTYLIVLLMIALMGTGLASVGAVWGTIAKREKEQELLFVGQQFRKAILSYRMRSPQGAANYPETLEDLLLDKRFPNVQRHLRRVYRDPLTGKPLWGLLYQQGRIVGVYSLAQGKPLIQAGFPPELAQFAQANGYADWRFVAEGVAIGATAPGITTAPIVKQPGTGPAPAPEPQAQSIPTPPAPCTTEYDRAVLSCWSDQAPADKNAECEARSQPVYNDCMRARLTPR